MIDPETQTDATAEPAETGDGTPPQGRLAGRIALVTGASRGIGRAVARRFAAEGAHVVAVARTLGALEELDDEVRAEGGRPLMLVAEDLTDYEKIDQIAVALARRFARLDVLVGNAGLLGRLGPVGHMDPEMFQRVLDVNLTVNWRLIRAMDPLLRQSEAGRAMFVTSSVGHEPRAYWGAYAISKAGLEMMVGVYAAELLKTNVKVNLINPGRTRTGMRREAYPGEDPETLPLPEAHADAFVRLATADCPDHGALIELATPA
ncbi:SDR family NAD(P)-dependent oxidoreductase [Roseospira visakhapatnamensis]|uniref:NAD(P)-dependent dehydrogenase (Short-subunit alcohol dehydrogenase family) n=1 Tax=Roseospira visakhapatnamensis TaxID=390880 RepID=A0A7W6RDY8_9PROT|nr:SDR family NAD(P)-dependent oxidoreductase [Roseospira visakhapatnamensis]MBB4266692.1 NAD(P)-dependent dehydrogenase (short-subunit alcohol dehydrogenase family) [Roseospira visakhapatnamensis]